jgi:predicted Zn-dependent protease
MQSFVITAEHLPGASDDFVFLAIDTERESNATLLKQLPVGVWPTFYIVDPKDRRVVGRWLGAASPAQLRRFLADGERAAALEQHADLAAGDPLKVLVEADALATRGDFEGAARAYGRALTDAGPSWPRRPETLVAQMSALWKAKRGEACLELGAKGLGETGDSASAVDFAYYALECSSLIASNDPRAGSLRRSIAQRLAPLCVAGSPELSPDDRADACDKLSAAQNALGDTRAAREATEQRLKVLEGAAAGKPPAVALTYDWARNDALLQLGRAEEALALAQARERELPDNYNPPHYQAKSYKALGKWEDGLAAIERASKLAYGPRRAGLLTLKAELLLGAGRNEEAVATLEQQLLAYDALPEGQKQPAAVARVERRLQEARAKTPPRP